MLPELCGPLEGTWRACGLRIVALPRLRQPWLVLRRDGPPCACLPAGVRGPMREVFFGWLIVELTGRHGERLLLATSPAVRRRERGYGQD